MITADSVLPLLTRPNIRISSFSQGGWFKSITGMQYVGLISVVVGVTNLIPTFGPIIGGAVGGIILLLVKPLHALIFIIFTFVLQFLDPYFIKPRLFGNTLGVSGLLILISVIVCGNMFGIFGLLIAIPLAAIVDFAYREWIQVILARRKKDRDSTGTTLDEDRNKEDKPIEGTEI